MSDDGLWYSCLGMRLADCSSERYCFELDPHTGVYSRLKLPTPRSERRRYSGMGQLLRSPREGKVLFAEYVLEGEAWFSIGAERWKRFDRALALTHRETCGGLLCRVGVYGDGTCLRTFSYLRRDWLTAMLDPTYDYLDFSLANLPVDLVPHDLSSLEKQRADFIEMWTDDSGSAGPGSP